MKAAFSRYMVLLAALSCASGCGDDGDESRAYETSCELACERTHDCDSSVDIETCASDCKDDVADIGPRLSGEFLDALDECIAGVSCPALALMPATEACQREAAARLAPSAAAEELCEAVVASIQMCAGISVGTAGCLDTVKIFSSSALTSARSCDEVPCDQRSDCLQMELGLDPSAM